MGYLISNSTLDTPTGTRTGTGTGVGTGTETGTGTGTETGTGTGTETGTENTPPAVDFIHLYDCDQDGNIDEIVFKFTEDMDDGSLTDSDAARVLLGGSAAVSTDTTSGGSGVATCSATSSEGIDPTQINDSFITFFSDDTSVEGTEAKSVAYTTATGALTDLSGNALANFNYAATDAQINDRAAPLIQALVAGKDAVRVFIFFTEPVQNSVAATCDGTLRPLANSDLTYQDNSGGDNNSMTLTDADACDKIIQANATATLAAADTASDAITAAANAIFDLAGNVAPTTAKALNTSAFAVVTAACYDETHFVLTFSRDVLSTTVECANWGACKKRYAEISPGALGNFTQVDISDANCNIIASGNHVCFTHQTDQGDASNNYTIAGANTFNAADFPGVTPELIYDSGGSDTLLENPFDRATFQGCGF